MKRPSLEAIRQAFTYDKERRILIWNWRDHVSNRWNAKFAGKVAGHTEENGYVQIQIDGYRLRLHQILWALDHGEWAEEIDHKNGDTSENSENNLRTATHAQNTQNTKMRTDNKSGQRGVCWATRERKWRATIQKQHLGFFAVYEHAVAAYQEAAKERFGEFLRAA